MKYILLLSLLLFGCTSQQWQAVATGIAASNNYSPSQSKIMIFGGPNNSVYLGCYSCSEYGSDSVFNQNSEYGNKYSSTSLFNSYSDYGSKYSDYGACNPYANNPPVIVDEKGGFYGYLTLNKYHSKVINNDTMLAWLSGACSAN